MTGATVTWRLAQDCHRHACICVPCVIPLLSGLQISLTSLVWVCVFASIHLCFVLRPNVCLSDVRMRVCLCPHSRVLPRKRAPEGESKMLPAAPVRSHSSWGSGEPLVSLEFTEHFNRLAAHGCVQRWHCSHSLNTSRAAAYHFYYSFVFYG